MVFGEGVMDPTLVISHYGHRVIGGPVVFGLRSLGELVDDRLNSDGVRLKSVVVGSELFAMCYCGHRIDYDLEKAVV